jgi:hypothetical protein
METLLLAMILPLAVAVVVLALMLRASKEKSASHVSIQSSIEHVRAIGHLSVFKVFTKEIVTATDHSWGEFGKRYLGWVLSGKKMAMIFEFEIDFRYDLRSAEFAVQQTARDVVDVSMPPCLIEAHVRHIHFYDEQRSKLLPWLLPDLLNGFFHDGFSEQDRNKLVSDAKAHAETQARRMIDGFQAEVQASAKATLEPIFRSLGANAVRFGFVKEARPKLLVSYVEQVAA